MGEDMTAADNTHDDTADTESDSEEEKLAFTVENAK